VTGWKETRGGRRKREKERGVVSRHDDFPPTSCSENERLTYSRWKTLKTPEKLLILDG